MTQTHFINTPIGPFEFILEDECLSELKLADVKTGTANLSDTAKAIAHEIEAYFSNPHHKWTIPLKLKVTPFQQKVLAALQHIPVGSTLTYGELARQLKTSARAIGQACRRNPIPIVIPCHRVVAARGIGGFAGERKGEMIERKEWLLKHERQATVHGLH